MSLSVFLNVAAVLCWVTGAVLLYRGRLLLAKPAASLEEALTGISQKDDKCHLLRRSGLAFVFLGFLLQCIAQFLPA